jgi:hypothetical protein
LHNHAPEVAAMDFFVVPTIGFDLLYAFVIVRLDRRDLVWINVTRNPTAAWVAGQITEAFPWEGSGLHDPGPGLHLWRHRHASIACHGHSGQAFCTSVAENHDIHLRRILRSYARYYNDVRTHRSLDKDAPISRRVQRTGSIALFPILGGLHHRYARV